VSGFGQTGRYAARPGFASVGEAMGGLRHVNGYPGQPPPRMGVSLGDSLAGMFAVQGITMALYWRDTVGGGVGQVVDASILESCFALLEGALTEYDRLGVVREASGTGLRNVAPSNIYRSSDGQWMVIAANADRIFQRLCEAMGQPELAVDQRFSTHQARGEHDDELDGIIAAWAAERTAEEIDRVLNTAHVVCGPIYSIADIYDDPHYRERDMILFTQDEHLGELAIPGFVPKLDRTPGVLRWTGPARPGAHNEDVYGELLGLGAAELEALEQAGLI
jgi:crotonobetainyl-CoA:carnitine CoA-transferase CaiB-like acyl-CoA transferase